MAEQQLRAIAATVREWRARRADASLPDDADQILDQIEALLGQPAAKLRHAILCVGDTVSRSSVPVPES